MTNIDKNHRFAFILITLLFFVWGFVHNLDPILIPHLKNSFQLSVLQSSLVDSSVFFAYFLMAIPAGMCIKSFGYQRAILLGLILFAIGSFLFIPAADIGSYGFFLMALFIVACGLVFLETAANPYASMLGGPHDAERYLNFAQSFNGLAATLAPIIGSRLILAGAGSQTEGVVMNLQSTPDTSSVKVPYLVLGCVVVALAIVFYFVKLPRMNSGEQGKQIDLRSALRHPQLVNGIVAQFFYVGAQVCVFSFFILYAVKSAALDKIAAADYLGWGCGMMFMVGRFVGTWLMKFILPAKLLFAYAFINICLAALAIFSGGLVSVYVVIAIAFFMSIMFPTIFSLGIKGLGADTEGGSSLIIMSIVGGAILPLLFGYISDVTENIQNGYFVPLICFAVVAWFAFKSIATSDKKNSVA